MPDDRENLMGENQTVAPLNLPPSKTEKLEELVDGLVGNYQAVRPGRVGPWIKTAQPGRDFPGHDLELYQTWLAEAHRYFREASHQNVSLTYASEWVLDNYYVIHQALQQIEEDLPSGFFRKLPKLVGGPFDDLPRIYAIARAVLAYQHLLLDPIELQAILVQFQERAPLTVAELWALPIFLRYSLIVSLAQALVAVIRPPVPPKLPVDLPQWARAGGALPDRETAADEAANQDSIPNIILSLKAISEQNWNDFFEAVSCLEGVLRQDPAGIYPKMTFKTRDRYRKEIETLSFATGRDESELAEIAIDLARAAPFSTTAAAGAQVFYSPSVGGNGHSASPGGSVLPSGTVHVGEVLLGNGRAALEKRIGYRPDAKTAFKRWVFQHAPLVYFSSILVLTVLLITVLSFAARLPEAFRTVPPSFSSALWADGRLTGGAAGQWIIGTLLTLALLIPVLTVATSLVNWLITLFIPPRTLPKLDFKLEIPDPFQTLVVIPAMITSREDIDSLIHQLELHYLRNPEPGLLFALLTDFRDADAETLPEDASLVRYALAAIETLNAKYENPSFDHQPEDASGDDTAVDAPQAGPPRFYFLHRKRLWNPSESRWMGWERKRGKLHELNLLLRGGGTDLSFTTLTDGMTAAGSALQRVHFVITLDTDTILPRGAACRLAGTLAHPLNRAFFDDRTGQVVSGYTVLQPRMEIHPKSANLSWFTRLFAGDAGLDLYTLAVSDAYQDLFGEGSYVGKGIYDVDAFEHSIAGHIPENSLLSHDLLEGLMGRAGLVTDITMIEEYPQNYYLQVSRQRRWIRGDWQLLPWLFQPNRDGLVFSAIDRWKMFDNLRRAILAPALLLIFIVGQIFLPGLASLWTAAVLLALGIPLFTGTAHGALQILGGKAPKIAFRPLAWNLLRWLLAVAFLPYEAFISIQAVLTTLYRMLISHHDLLQWTTSAQTAKTFGKQARRNTAWQKMGVSTFLALTLTLLVQLVSEPPRVGLAPALSAAAPVLLLWLFAPLIAWWINRPFNNRPFPLNEEQINLLRRVTRRTWGFFERFVGPEDHWLPPDHYQETPVGTIAHRTSPTNIGLLLTSTLAAYDFGYLDQLGLATRLATTVESLDQLERFRGHFLNWYDTLSLQPLHPRYVSTVDSGNLAASLIVTAQACRRMPDEPLFRWDLWQGYLDTLANLTETLTGISKAEFAGQVEEINRRIAAVRAEILAVRSRSDRWYPLYLQASGPFWQDLSHRLMELLVVGRTAFDLETLRKLQEVTLQVERHHTAVYRTIAELTPWIPLFANLPERLREPAFMQAITALQASLPGRLALGKMHANAAAALSQINELRSLLTEENLPVEGEAQAIPLPGNGQDKTALKWLEDLVQALSCAEENASSLLARYKQIGSRADQLVNEMDFHFLYQRERRVFHIGFNLDAGQLDPNYYDLLASEARIASIVAIAKGDVPQSHWLHLGRPLTQVEGAYVLLSWSGTMFEYLMPPLFLRSYPGTMLADSAQGAVHHQIAYGKAQGTPWGISEAGFYRFDANQNYQYRAFGVPGLGFKRGLGDDLVIAPYASLMAIGVDPHAVVRNLMDLLGRKSMGLYGVYESLDFTPDRLLIDQTSAVVGEYMAHHQGMILMAMANYFHEDVMVRRMHGDPRIQSVELLLQEQVPQTVPLQDPYAKDVKGIQRISAAPVEIIPWRVPPKTMIPQVHLLSNGDYNLLLSNMGGGYSSWRETDLTRWQPDGVLDPWGTWIYIQEMDPGLQKQTGLWSAGQQPIPGNTADMQVTYFAHMAVYARLENGIASTMEVTVASDDPVEIRRIHLHNTTDASRSLRLTSYGEVILTPQATDTRHPAFNKLFIESEFVPELNLQIFTRRPRSSQDSPILMGHMLVVKDSQAIARHEADRFRFIGRDRTSQNPDALTSGEYLSGTTGATLDPIFALGQEIRLDPHENGYLAYLTFAGESREAILALANRYRSWPLVERSFHQANIAAQTWLGKQEMDTRALQDALRVLSALIYSFKLVRAAPETIAANRLGQSGLWRFGISGDNPILMVELDDPKQVDLVREALQVHKYLRSRRWLVDVVILNRQQIGYGAELNGMLYRLVHQMNGEQWLNQRGGIYILYGEQMGPDELILLETAAHVLLKGANGPLNSQMPGYSFPVHHLPELIPTLAVEGPIQAALPPQSDPLEKMGDLQFYNGYGGFSADGREYVIDWNASTPGTRKPPTPRPTPAPWVNVIGYPEFGFLVSEAGSQCTWALNSGENRLSPWSNDPVRDPTGEALYLRDEETGEVWTPTPLPSGTGQPYRVTHGAGYTFFEHNSHGLRQRLTLFASPDDPVKIIRLRVENTLAHTRRITATQYVEWVLGTTRAASTAYIIPEYDPALECLLASNPYNAEFGARTAFLIANKPIHGLTADRTEFLGRGGTYALPAALQRLGLETRITPGEDPCAVLQVHLDLHPGASEEIYFILGQGNDRDHAISLAKKYHDPASVDIAFERTHAFWDQLLGAVQVHTPEPATDLILNRWMLYQALSCRIWGRTGFYQSSGAYGFRDQLQDVLAVLPANPGITRGQILNAAQRQFEEGDVLHWWHPPSGRGVRTRISDDLLWLPYITALYVEATGDMGILDEKIPFRVAPPLAKGEDERYSEYPQTEQVFSLMEHCRRAIQKGATAGLHGLPLIGTGDWNDGLNRVGAAGRGESTWLAWFLCDVLERFAAICEASGDIETAQRFRSQGKGYAAAVEQAAWDGAWYQRAYYDDGTPLGSIQDPECQIDAISQSWAVLSGAGDPQRSRQAMQSVLDRLVHPQDRLIQLFTPPFDKTPRDPGYIKGYLPGTRENGGQYTHAATWTAWAFARLGNGEQAGELFNLLNPIYQSDSVEKVSAYRVEPYVICADIYSRAPYLRRGGWTWYTGSAAWMYRLGLEAMLGFHKVGNSLHIDPVIPPKWDEFEIRYRYGEAVYLIQVRNPEHVASGVRQILLDGQTLEGGSVPLFDGKKEYLVVVSMGKSEKVTP